MPHRFPIALLIATLALVAVWSGGAAMAQDEGGRLRVGVPERPPFAIQSRDGSWQGIAVDLWRMIAEENHLDFDLVRVPREQAIDALAAGRLDIVLAVNATPANEARVELLTPFYTSTLALVSKREIALGMVIRNILSADFMTVMVSLSLLLLIVGALVWLVERRHNSAQFHRRPLLGLGDGFWWAGVTLTTIGYGDKTPKSLLGRTIAMLWMLIGLGVSAALTATVISATNIEGNTGLAIPGDLEDRRVGAVGGSSAASYLYGEALAVEEFPSLTEAIEALRVDQIDAVAGGYAALRFAATSLSNAILSTSSRDPHYITIAVAPPTTDAEREQLNELRAAVLRRITSDGWWRLVERYLPPPTAGLSSQSLTR